MAFDPNNVIDAEIIEETNYTATGKFQAEYDHPQSINEPDPITNDQPKGFTINPIEMTENGFRVSEEEAARIRAQAMANQGGDNPFQAAFGMNPDDYDKKIPNEVHNAIAKNEAKEKIQEAMEEAKKFTDEVITENSTKEILNELEGVDANNDFKIEDVNKIINAIPTLSFLEAVSFRKQIDKEIAQWKSCHFSVKSIRDLKLDDDINKEIMVTNAMKEYGIDSTVSEFDSVYEDSLTKLATIANALAEHINQYKNKSANTSFLNDEMLTMLNRKLDALDENGMNYSYFNQRLRTTIRAFTNRCELTYLEDRFTSFLRSSKSYIKRKFKDDETNLNLGRNTKTINELIASFNLEIYKGFVNVLKEIFDNDTAAIYLFIVFINKVMNSERKSMKNSWVKVFVMNLADIDKEVFDMMDPEEFKTKTANVFKDICISTVKDFKLDLNSDKVTFGI